MSFACGEVLADQSCEAEDSNVTDLMLLVVISVSSCSLAVRFHSV